MLSYAATFEGNHNLVDSKYQWFESESISELLHLDIPSSLTIVHWFIVLDIFILADILGHNPGFFSWTSSSWLIFLDIILVDILRHLHPGLYSLTSSSWFLSKFSSTPQNSQKRKKKSICGNCKKKEIETALQQRSRYLLYIPGPNRESEAVG